MSMFDDAVAELLLNDDRYELEAYEFIFHALHHAQKLLNRLPPEEERSQSKERKQYHVSGPELLEGVRDLALRDFGLMARTVFRMWGINETADFGEIVFNLIDVGLMSRTNEDSREDFQNIYDLDEALVKGYRIHLDEVR